MAGAAEIATRLRDSLTAERERLTKRPVPTTPWVMPIGLDDLDVLAGVANAAQDYIAALDAVKDAATPPERGDKAVAASAALRELRKAVS